MSEWTPFTRNVTKTLPFPGNDAESVTIRKLGYKALEEAMKERQLQGLDYVRRLGPGGLLKEMQDQGGEDAVREKAKADPYLQYDRNTLLTRGIASWTLTPSVPPKPTDIEDLDTETADWLAREIYAMSKPKTEEERKNA